MVPVGGEYLYVEKPSLELLGQLGSAIGDFVSGLRAIHQLDRVLVMVFSEFGRRVAENASGGTDHGEAGVMFVIGGGVRPGLYGQGPDLERLHRGDVAWTTDFRSVYAALLHDWLDLDPEWRQRIEEFVGEEDQRLPRQVLDGRAPLDGGVRAVKRCLLHFAQHRARLNECDRHALQEFRNAFPGAHGVRHERAAARSELGDGDGFRFAHGLPHRDGPEPEKLAEDLADFRCGDEVAIGANGLAGGVGVPGHRQGLQAAGAVHSQLVRAGPTGRL